VDGVGSSSSLQCWTYHPRIRIPVVGYQGHCIYGETHRMLSAIGSISPRSIRGTTRVDFAVNLSRPWQGILTRYEPLCCQSTCQASVCSNTTPRSATLDKAALVSGRTLTRGWGRVRGTALGSRNLNTNRFNVALGCNRTECNPTKRIQ
jgi:hypothetical protein